MTEKDCSGVIIDYYRQIFDNKNSIYRINFHEAISFLDSDGQVYSNKKLTNGGRCYDIILL